MYLKRDLISPCTLRSSAGLLPKIQIASFGFNAFPDIVPEWAAGAEVRQYRRMAIYAITVRTCLTSLWLSMATNSAK